MHPSLFSSSLLLLTALLCSSCTSTRQSGIIDVVDLPLKVIEAPEGSWDVTPLRAHARYFLDHAESRKEKIARLGDYYFVNWHDADPSLPAEVRMYYTQARTGSKIQTISKSYPAARPSVAKRESQFFFNGQRRAKYGDILSWRVDLLINGQSVSSKQSFLWE